MHESAVLAALLLRETLSPGEMAGCALMLAAMLALFRSELARGPGTGRAED